jgi:hypothetical protein
MKPGLFAAVIVAVFLLGFGVGRTSSQPSTPSMPSMTAASPTAQALPPPAGMGMGMGAREPGPGGSGVSGTVAEVIQVPNYTYLRLNTGGGEAWAAVSTTTEVKEGQAVSVTGTQMLNFASSTLKRTFPTIWFGSITSSGTPAPSLMPAPTAVAPAMAPIEPAAGPLGLRVAEVYSKRLALAGKTVRVRALVTRVSPIQGVNYVHLKDGSGSAASADDDLVVMTTAQVKVDAVPTLEGRVVVDKDVGMGPRPVMLEDATLVP